ncbi:hypothetical protein [Paenibacillus sp. WLX2291]|uniref:hypothetical protein n=1 Tax=Paenibacillus sp. WLX2291 TaxID=3296934 RepID=UPI003984576D
MMYRLTTGSPALAGVDAGAADYTATGANNSYMMIQPKRQSSVSYSHSYHRPASLRTNDKDETQDDSYMIDHNESKEWMLSRLLEHAASLLGLRVTELKQYLQDGDHVIHIAEHQGIAATKFRKLLSHNISLTLKKKHTSGKITHLQYEQYMDILDEQLAVIIAL